MCCRERERTGHRAQQQQQQLCVLRGLGIKVRSQQQQQQQQRLRISRPSAQSRRNRATVKKCVASSPFVRLFIPLGQRYSVGVDGLFPVRSQRPTRLNRHSPPFRFRSRSRVKSTVRSTRTHARTSVRHLSIGLEETTPVRLAESAEEKQRCARCVWCVIRGPCTSDHRQKRRGGARV